MNDTSTPRKRVIRAMLLALVVWLCAPQTAKAGIKPVSDDQQFVSSINSLLKTLAASDSKCKGIVRRLRKSERLHEIVKFGADLRILTMPKNDKKAKWCLKCANGDTSPRCTDGCVGTGSTTFFGILGNAHTCNLGVITTDAATLCHELSHADDMDQGISDKRTLDGPGFASVAESKAVRAENSLRGKGVCNQIIADPTGGLVKNTAQCDSGEGCELNCVPNAAGDSGVCRPLTACEGLVGSDQRDEHLKFIANKPTLCSAPDSCTPGRCSTTDVSGCNQESACGNGDFICDSNKHKCKLARCLKEPTLCSAPDACTPAKCDPAARAVGIDANGCINASSCSPIFLCDSAAGTCMCDVGGAWQGSLGNDWGGRCTIDLELAQSGQTIGGSFSYECDETPGRSASIDSGEAIPVPGFGCAIHFHASDAQGTEWEFKYAVASLSSMSGAYCTTVCNVFNVAR